MKIVGRIINSSSSKYLSPLEVKVHEAFEEWGIGKLVTPNLSVRSFQIDLALVSKKIAIEIDGEKFHSSPEQIEKDKFRQEILEKEGWHFERFDGWFAYRYPTVIVAKIILRYLPEIDEQIKRRALTHLGNFFKERGQTIHLGKILIDLSVNNQ